MDIIEPAFSRISLNELYEQPIISARREHNTHANNVPLHFFDVKAPVTCCANRYCFAEHTNRYIWLTEHRCCHRLAQPMRNWIEDVLCMQNNTIPILENPLHTTANEIRDKLLEGCFDLNGFDKVQVNVRAGHLFSLCEQVDGSIEITEEERGFSQQWPLFVDVTIYAQEATFPSNTCQVLITVGKCGSGGQVHPEPYVLLQEIATTPRHHYGGMGGIAVA